MTLKYFLGMFLFFFVLWVAIVDQALIPSMNELKQDVGVYSRYKLKQSKSVGRFEIFEDELLIYAVVNHREQLYYMNSEPGLESLLKQLPSGTPLQLRYASRLPKVWKKYVYEIRSTGSPLAEISAAQIANRQRRVWKATGLLGAAFLLFLGIGLIKKRK